MNESTRPEWSPGRAGREVRAGIAFAAAFLAISLGAKLAVSLGWTDASDVPERALMVALGAFFVVTANALPKTLAPLSAQGKDPVCAQAFRRFVGWTWVLSGLTFALAWIVLPLTQARAATFVVLPGSILIVAMRWWWLRRAG